MKPLVFGHYAAAPELQALGILQFPSFAMIRGTPQTKRG
jgi:hypothetical protein